MTHSRLEDRRRGTDEDERADALSAIAREMRYRDALHKLRDDVERLRGLVTLSGRAVVTNEIVATIDAALALGDFGGLPDPGEAA